MDFETTLTIIFAAFAIAEVLQVFLLRAAVIQIRDKVEDVLPEGKTASSFMSEAVFEFMDQINTDPKKAQIVGTFIGNAAEVGFMKVKGSIPFMGGEGGLSGDFMSRLEKKNPLAALVVSGLQMAAPMIQQQMQANQASPKPGSNKKGGVIGYG